MALRRALARLLTLQREAMAAAAARGQRARTCAVARVHAIRAEGEAATAAVMARVRAARARVRAIVAEGDVASAAVRSRAEARVRAILAQGDAASAAVLSRAEARARAATAHFLRLQGRSEMAAVSAAVRLRHAYYTAASSVLKVSYGQSAPPTPTPFDLLKMMLVQLEKATNIYNLVLRFEGLDPIWQYYIVSVILGPLVSIVNDVQPSAPECLCPFLGIEGLPFDICPVSEGLFAVVSVSASSASVLLLYVGGILISLCPAVIWDPWVRDEDAPLADEHCDPSVSLLNQFCGKKKLRRMILMVIVESLSVEEVGGLHELFKMLKPDGSGTVTFDQLSCVLKMGGSWITEHELMALMNVAGMDLGEAIKLGEFVAARRQVLLFPQGP